jgi:hypothetical protein
VRLLDPADAEAVQHVHQRVARARVGIDHQRRRLADVYLVDFGGVGAGQYLSAPFTVFAPAVPEPQTYALMALGLAAVGIAVRRRRN